MASGPFAAEAIANERARERERERKREGERESTVARGTVGQVNNGVCVCVIEKPAYCWKARGRTRKREEMSGHRAKKISENQ